MYFLLAPHFLCPVAKREPVLRAYLHGGSGGEATHHSHSVLLKDLQGLGAFATSRQHHVRLQGERGNLLAGKRATNEKEVQHSYFRGRTSYESILDTDQYPGICWKTWDC